MVILKSKSVSYLQKMLRFLVKHGKKSVMERNVYIFLKTKMNKNNKSFKDLLEQNMHKSIPYVNLKMRRKGRNVLYKVADISNQKAEKQSLLFFSKSFRQQHREKFSIKFEKELEKTFSEKNIGTEKRDEIHQKALKYLDIETEDTEDIEESEEHEEHEEFEEISITEVTLTDSRYNDTELKVNDLKYKTIG